MKQTLVLVNHFHKHRYELRQPFTERGMGIYQYYEVLLEFVNCDLANVNQSLPTILSLFNLTEISEELIELQAEYRIMITTLDTLEQKNILDSLQRNYFFYYDSSSGLILPAFEIYTLTDYLQFELMHLFAYQVKPAVCQHCGRFFFPGSRSDEKYCDYVNQNKKTCKQLGYAQTVKEKNPFQFEYRKAYKTQYARIRYFEHIENYKELYFHPWNQDALTAKAQFENSNDLEGFQCWLKNSHERYHPKKGDPTASTLCVTL